MGVIKISLIFPICPRCKNDSLFIGDFQNLECGKCGYPKIIQRFKKKVKK
jgi:ribosomal protein S27AE